MAEDIPRDKPILLFDGVCNLCNGSIQFVIEHDPEGVFRFAPLQSAAGERLLDDVGFEDYDFDTFVLVDGDDYYTKSEAALRVASELEFPWSLAGVGRVVPRPLRDAVYDTVASHRYAVFGKKAQCMIPSPEIRERFVEMSDGRAEADD
ncbi:thiol-disulfide oxidoreductase DCC family protein [Halosimplex pelagicum]|uniref:Thiol-disulfide oxidoreductase DCC family protein n=1 Tax=Halosimplex pelagicum TaxID=869886 RepID=A0A7D5P8T1_9EURY|nr:thiol-disulfide oxidoreductase DCC family protein [Halosimplex pelagicum]QLH81604.1 thiol-disulfide oxidoreductase DCC family protein [Halosimplex pelagicum]